MKIASYNVENIFEESNPRNKLIAEILFKCDFVESFGDGVNKIYSNQVRFGKDVPDYSKSHEYKVDLVLNTEITSLKLAKIVDRLESSGFKLRFKELRFLNDLIRNGKVGQDIEFFIKNNILDEKGRFIGNFEDLNADLVENVQLNVNVFDCKFFSKFGNVLRLKSKGLFAFG